MISRRELIDIHDRLSAAEIVMMLAMELVRFGVDMQTVRHERMERKAA